MDLKELAQNAGLEEEEFIELVELFLETSASDLERLEEALAIEDAQGVYRAAHSIKGAAINLGIHEVFELAKGVEVRARQNFFDESREAVNVLKERMCALAEVLESSTLLDPDQMSGGVSNS